ncbi:MAG: ABC transporter ATP-binding protein [Spongiibacteraceae bacterium]|jgi:iron(III) transport system ATP-binding protein|nr:ABC transporter ATP-binding protein [Spongiibacteraceae bacterium]
MPPLLAIDAVSVAYGSTQVLHQIALTLSHGSIGCLLGPSGCGKTTLLRAIAGFEPVSAGSIALEGQVVSAPGRTLPPERRQIGMVFQDFALFPHLSIADNIAFGLRGWSASDRRQRVEALLRLVGLSGYGRHYPHQLSGGQQQRVALARALAPRPRLLLLDEPFSSLDVTLREGLAREVREILSQEGTSAILVTHDQQEAFAFADEIGVMAGGRLLQWDSGYNLYHRPASRTVAQFVGQGQMVPGRWLDTTRVETPLGILRSDAEGTPGAEVDVLVRPDDLVHVRSGDSSASGALVTATVINRVFRGAEYLYTVQLGSGQQLLCLTPSHDDVAPGERMALRLDQRHLVVFPRQTA